MAGKSNVLFSLMQCIQEGVWMRTSEGKDEIGSNIEVMENDFTVLRVNLLILVHRWDDDSICSPLNPSCPLAFTFAQDFMNR